MSCVCLFINIWVRGQGCMKQGKNHMQCISLETYGDASYHRIMFMMCKVAQMLCITYNSTHYLDKHLVTGNSLCRINLFFVLEFWIQNQPFLLLYCIHGFNLM